MGNQIMRLAVKYLIDEARRRNINIEMINSDTFSATYNGHTEYFDETLCSKTTATAVEFCYNKNITKLLLEKNNISVPRGSLFVDKDEAREFVRTIGWPIVVKPCYGQEGDLVFAGLENSESFERAFESVSLKYKEVIVEEFFQATEYRVFATRERALSVVNRIPANVIGDGTSSIEELVNEKNKDPRRQQGLNPLAQIIIDDVVLSNLSRQSISLDSVIERGKQIFLRENSNISTGGESVELSECADPSVAEIAVKAINSVPGLLYGGVDFMTKDIRSEQTPEKYRILEINSQPGIALHQNPTLGNPKNISKHIFDLVFPET